MKQKIEKLKSMFAFIVSWGLLATNLFAADVRMNVQPDLIGLLDRAVLKIEFIDTKGDAVDIPDVDGLNIQYQGQSSETRIVNMRSSTKMVHNYIITPTKVGDYTIGPVTCNYKGGSKTLSTKLKVIKPQNDQEVQNLTEIMFAEISSPRPNPYVQEEFGIELKVFIRNDVQTARGFRLLGGMPESGLAGTPEWKNEDVQRVERDGQIFTVHILRTTTKALTAGTFTFQPEVQVNIVIPRQRRRSFGFDDPFFGDLLGRQETRPIVLECNRLNVNVTSVPTENQPDSYTGGIGSFGFSVEVTPKEVRVGEPITVRMRVTGNGNLDQVTPPPLPNNTHLKVYNPNVLPSTLPNEKIFEQVIIPRSEEISEIPPISFSFFNTKTASYLTQTRGPFPITVKPAPNGGAQVINSLPSDGPEEAKVLGHDIVYLKARPETWTTATHPPPSTRLYLLIGFPMLWVIASALYAARRNNLEADGAKVRRQKAPKIAAGTVRIAEQAVRSNDEKAFYEALWNTLAVYFSHRLNLPIGDISASVLLDRFSEDAQQEKEALQALFSEIEQKRYGIGAGETSPDAMRTQLNQLKQILKQCERMKL